MVLNHAEIGEFNCFRGHVEELPGAGRIGGKGELLAVGAAAVVGAAPAVET